MTEQRSVRSVGIAKAILDLFRSLPKNGKPQANEYTVLAGVLRDHTWYSSFMPSHNETCIMPPFPTRAGMLCCRIRDHSGSGWLSFEWRSRSNTNGGGTGHWDPLSWREEALCCRQCPTRQPRGGGCPSRTTGVAVCRGPHGTGTNCPVAV